MIGAHLLYSFTLSLFCFSYAKRPGGIVQRPHNLKNAKKLHFPNLRSSIKLVPLPVNNLPDMPDEELLKLCLGQDPPIDAWTEFVRRIHKMSGGVVYNVLNRARIASRENIDDVLGDTVCTLLEDNYRRLREYKPQHKDSFKGYVQAIAWSRAFDFLRKFKIHENSDDIDLPDSRTALEESVFVNAIFAYVEKTSEKLEYHIFVLRYREGLTAPEIAKRPEINLSVREVEYILWKIVKKLRGKFGQN